MFKKYNTPEDFAKLSIKEIQEEIKTCGLFRSKAEKIKQTSEQLCNVYNGEVPNTLEDLKYKTNEFLLYIKENWCG